MKRMFFLGFLGFFFAPMVWAQEKIEVPVWNVGDRWVFTQGMKIEVIGAEQNSYVVEYPTQTMIYSKSTLNRIYILQGKKREPYKESQRRFFNFPLMMGKSWKDTYSVNLRWEDAYAAKPSYSLGEETQIFENYKVMGWEDVELRAGSVKAIKVEYRREWSTPASGMRDGRIWYWYCPEIKNIVKVQYEKNQIWSKETDFELVSFQFGK